MRLRHICEVCGKEEILTPEEAFELGWDYPPKIGEFKKVSQRICGNCGVEDTLWFALTIGGKQPIELNEKHRQTLDRILNEPESIMVKD